MMVCLVSLFLTSARSVTEVRPQAITSTPISMMSPCCAELTKLISDMNLVTRCRFPPSWHMA